MFQKSQKLVSAKMISTSITKDSKKTIPVNAKNLQ